MFQFIFTNILFISLGLILYLVIRALPRVEEPGVAKKPLLERWLASGIPEKIDGMLASSSLKILRRSRVVVLRVDNALSGRLQRRLAKDNGAKPAIDFEEIKSMPAEKPSAKPVARRHKMDNNNG